MPIAQSEFPATAEIIACSEAQGNHQESFDFEARIARDRRLTGIKSTKFPVLSWLSGNLATETSSRPTMSATTQSGRKAVFRKQAEKVRHFCWLAG